MMTKTAKCLFLTLICLLLGAILLTGCKQKPDAVPEGTSGDEGNDHPAAGELFPLSRLQEMKIVYHEGAPDLIIEAAQALGNAIKASYKVEIPVTSDYIRPNSEHFCEKEYEILVGVTDRDEDDAYEHMRVNDSVYTVAGTKIVIIGGDNYASVAAATNFTYDIVTMKKGGSETFFKPEWGKEFKQQYTLNTLTINGIPVSSYSVVYPGKGTDYESGIAEHVAARLELLTGYVIPVRAASGTYQNGYEIVIGKTARPGTDAVTSVASEPLHGVFGTAGNMVVLSGADAYGINMAAEEFLKACETSADADGNAAVTLSGVQTAEPATEVSMMSFNIQTWGMGRERNARVIKMIHTYLPDVVGVQEANADWMTILNEKFSNYYTIIGVGRNVNDTGERCAILISKRRLDILEQGTRWLTNTPEEVSQLTGAEYYRIYTYAKLSDRVSDKEFLHVNTHLDTAGDSIRTQEVNMIFEFLHMHEDLPVILTGDLNATLGSTPIRTLQKGGLTSASDLYSGKNALPRIDWIFVTEDCVNVEYFRICNERVNGDYPSDHSPVLTKITFYEPEGGIRHDFGEVLPLYPEGYLEVERDKEGESLGGIHRVH